MKIELRSFKSSEHNNEERDGPFQKPEIVEEFSFLYTSVSIPGMVCKAYTSTYLVKKQHPFARGKRHEDDINAL